MCTSCGERMVVQYCCCSTVLLVIVGLLALCFCCCFFFVRKDVDSKCPVCSCAAIGQTKSLAYLSIHSSVQAPDLKIKW